MSEMMSTQVADATAKPILEFGRSWMVDPGTWARAQELGLAESGRFGFWVSGRAGVLGEVDAQVAAAALGFMAPDAVAMYWSARPETLSAGDAALAWFDSAATWGRTVFDAMDESRVRPLADLSRTVIDAADVSIGMLFAGSKLIPLPGDAAGDATVNLNVLRELRGGAHLSACHAAGLGPHATIMSTDDPVRGGSSWAEGFGWQAPHPPGDPARRADVEALTGAAMSGVYDALTSDEKVEFVALVDEARGLLD